MFSGTRLTWLPWPRKRISHAIIGAVLAMYCFCAVSCSVAVTFHVKEESQSGVTVGSLHVITTSFHNYELQKQTAYSDYFAYDKKTGIVTTTRVIDRDVLPGVCQSGSELAVILFISSKHGESRISAKIIIDDINDHSPKFPLPTETIEISEERVVGHTVPISTAIDPDCGSNGTISQYSIREGNESGSFGLQLSNDRRLLSLVLLKNFDRETELFHVLNISACDDGSPQRCSFFLLNVTVADYNDNKPLFHNIPLRIPVKEQCESGRSILTLIVTDADSGKNGKFSLSLKNTHDFQTSQLFQINNTSQQLMTTECLTYKRDIKPYTVVIQAEDHGHPVQHSDVTIQIDVVDINDHSPIITEQLSLPIEENKVINAAGLVFVEDDDAGQNANVTLEIISGNSNHMFYLERSADTIFILKIRGTLDREEVAEYNLTIQGFDQGYPRRSTTHSFLIPITDVNDNPPICQISETHISISESVPVGSYVTIIHAVDKDEGENGKVKYSLANDKYRLFKIEEHSGLLTTNAQLDYETQASVEIKVILQDGGKIPLSSFCSLTVNITDVNDNIPLFANKTFNVAITEDNVVGSVVLKLTASDADKGDNSRLTFNLLFATPLIMETFHLNSTSGIIQTLLPLDREIQDFYHFQVSVHDYGSPPLSSIAVINIQILDINDNPPIIYPRNYYSNIPWNQTINGFFTTISATDIDNGENGTILYKIIHSEPQDIFQIDKKTGQITAASSLLNSQTNYVVEIIAEDGQGISSNVSTLKITVLTGQENLPKFEMELYIFNIEENVKVGTYIGFVSATWKLSSGAVAYIIYDGDPYGIFSINDKGELRTMKQIDSEKQSQVNLKVMAKILEPSLLIAWTSVNIIVEDVNDNPPIFSHPFQGITIEDTTPVGSIIYKASAFDPDLDIGGIVKYELSYDHDKMFNIDRTTGNVFVAGSLSRLTNFNSVLKIIATDWGLPNLTSSLHLTVNVIKVNIQPPLFPSKFTLVQLTRNSPINQPFLNITASDLDGGINSRVYFHLSGEGNKMGYFGIFPNGTLYVKQSLLLTIQSMFSMEVIARDTGTPQLNSSTLVNISVLSEHQPLFKQDIFRFIVNENENPGTLVGKLDLVRSATVSLVLEHPDFTFNLMNYEIRTRKVLDREMLYHLTGSNGYILYAKATDSDKIDPVEELATIFVKVKDENDNKPVFSHAVYSLQVLENEIPGTRLLKLPASDQDETKNSKMKFSIVNSSTPGIFVVDEKGYVTLNQTLKNKNLFHFNITVQVTNIAPPYFYSRCVIEAMVKDVNNNPPKFSKPLIMMNVNESFPLKHKVLQVSASDKDFGRNSRLAYTITGGNTESIFKIDRASGEVTLIRELDFETQQRYVLNITAVDSGAPPLFSMQSVVMNVTDVNDNPPCFVNCPSTLSIQENITMGTAIGQCLAKDMDTGVNGMISYSIIGENPIGYFFRIDPDNGTVYTNTHLDREQFQSHKINIKAEDKAVPVTFRLSCTKTVSIRLDDVNDNFPYFTSPPAQSFIPSNATTGSYLMTLTARDPDVGLNSNITFKKGAGGDSEIFSINSNGRIIFAIAPSGKHIYMLNVIASDLGTPPKETSQQITIFAVGDRGLSFRKKEYSFSIVENKPIGTFLIKVIAYGAPQIKYFMTKDSSGGQLVLNSTTGDIFTNARLDREGEPGNEINLVIYAVDINGKVPNTVFVGVSIVILDENDNVPTFSQGNYVREVTENAKNGSNILTLHAHDDDQGRNGSVMFNIVGGNEGQFFRIDVSTGQVYLTHTLDHELRSSYHLNVTASDLGKPPLSSWSTVVINVLDVNDNSPVFERTSYSFTVMENSPVGTILGETVAKDRDSKHNGRILYCLSGEDSKLFSVNAKSGILRTATVFDREKIEVYLIKVVAMDQGKRIQLSASVFVYINILDENDNTPAFNGRQPFKVTMPENSVIGTSILTLGANDKDFDLNSKLTYSISGGNNAKAFRISLNGTLFTASILDRETKDNYDIQVAVSDSPQDFSRQRSSTVSVFVSVLDVNDETPSFESPDIVHVREDQRINEPFTTVVAVDRDIGLNGEIIYELQGVLANERFQINRYSGALSLKQALDREEITSGYIIITVEAKDRGKPPKFKRRDIKILLDDVNDNSPIFFTHKDHVRVHENISIGTELIQVTAVDIDQGHNGLVEYAIVGGNVNNTFGIHPVDGTVRVIKPLDRESLKSYQLDIKAFDLGKPQQDNVTVFYVDVIDVNDNPPRFQQPRVTEYVMENVNFVQTLATFTATDDDEGRNGEITYSIVHQSKTPFLDIDASNGIVSLISPLDRERQSKYSVLIEAKDKGIPQLKARSSLTIIVEDENDHSPAFVNSDLRESIVEGSSVGSRLCVMNATDPDDGSNGQISYSLVNDFSRFKIDPKTGEIFITAELDREIHGSQFKLVVKAQDGGKPRRVTFGSVIGHIQDIDDKKAIFKSNIYTVYIRVGVPSGTFVGAVVAVDEDEGSNGKVVYEIKDGSTLFYVESDTGHILTKTRMPLSSASFTLRIVAMNAKTYDEDDTTTVYVIVSAQTFPVFNILNHVFNISEDTKPGYHILRVKATDDPTFHIVDGDLEEQFSLDLISGNLTLGKELDYEKKRNYSLWLKASLNNRYSTYVNIQVFVVDVNDNKPIFSESYYVAYVTESPMSNSKVTQIVAEDYDSGLFGLVNYSIVEASGRAWFHIDKDTGDVYTTQGIDREQISMFNFTVQAEDQGFPPKKSVATLRVNIVDANDNPPVFDEIPLVYVMEDATPVLLVTTVSTEDKDETSRHYFSLASVGNYDSTFSIETLTGDVFLKKRLDREKVASYPLTVIVTDGRFTRNASLNVIILDVDDNPPKFLNPVYSVKILELMPIGSVVINLNVSDADNGPNADAVYSLIRTLTSDKFRINSMGIITIASPLQFIKSDSRGFDNPNEYNCTVIAKNPSHPLDKAIATVIIEVMDANDHSPEFEIKDYFAYVPSVSKSGTGVLSVNATDEYDVGPNSEVLYDVVGGNGTNIFIVDTNTGLITVNSALTSFVDNLLLLELRAKDRGKPIQTSNTTAKVFITITAENKHSPVFNKRIYVAKVVENYEVGKEFLRVSASDADDGVNGRVSYCIRPDKQGKYFKVDSRSGSVTIGDEKLDYENRSEYSFDILAKDGARHPKTASATVKVTVTDYNDNPPAFPASCYQVNVLENSPIGSVVVVVTATDRDTIGNKVSYALTGNDKDFFSIDKDSGEITTKSLFDYESRNIYYFTVLAKDNGHPQKTSDCNVDVAIKGVNEFTPKFSQKQYSFSSREDSPIGTTIGRVSATDGDKGIDGIVQYILVDPSGNKKNVDVNQHTGDIFVKSHLDSETTDRVQLTVLAINPMEMIVNADNTDKATVVIKVKDTNDPPRFLRRFVKTSVEENTPVGTSVANFSAVDDDVNTNFTSPFIYKILLGNINDSFHLVRVDAFAIIKTAKTLDREKVTLFNLTIAVTDIAEPSLFGIATLIVVVKDVNDNAPFLKPGLCPGHVKENLPTGTVVLRFDAFDRDIDPNKDPYTFQIVSQERVPFVIDKSTWELKTNAILDRERVSIYTLHIELRDSGYPKQSSVEICRITVDDVNDNLPSAETRVVKINVPATEFTGGVIGDVSPIDADLINGYTCEVEGKFKETFSFLPSSCILNMKKPLPTFYVLNVRSRDELHQVSYSLNISFNEISNITSQKSVILRLSGISPEKFLSVMDSLPCKSGYNKQILSVQKVNDTVTDVLLAHLRNGVYISRKELTQLLEQCKNNLEKRLGAKIMDTNYNLCSYSDPCIHGECQPRVILFSRNRTTLSYKSDVFVSAFHRPSVHCVCHTGYSGPNCQYSTKVCSSKPCKNYGRCVPTENSFICECLPNYTGRLCDTPVNLCDPNPCNSPSKCISSSKGPKCQCDFGGRGERCELTSIGFQALSYMKLPTLQSSKRKTFNNITLQFATVERNALIFYNSDNKDSHSSTTFIALEIIEGLLRFSFNLGGGTARIVANGLVSDGQWHTVTAVRNKWVRNLYIFYRHNLQCRCC